MAQIYGLELSFVATRSGLTRLKLFESNPRVLKLAEVFARKHNKAIEEPWYMRTIDWNMRPATEDSLLITVPYNANARLIAKLRQRITQRHPMASNDSRSNCDPSWDREDEELPAETRSPLIGDGDAASGSVSTTASSTEASSGGSTVTSTRQPLEATMKPTTGEESSSSLASQPQNDEPSDDEEESQSGSTEAPAVPKIDYNAYSTYDFLDLLANSSVHVSATQAIVAHRGDRRKRTPVGVAGLLYDYATFARSFLNSTSITIEQLPASAANLDDLPDSGAASDTGDTTKVELCPGGECATKCGYRNDTIDCLLVDNNGFIVVAEDLPNVGRSLADYDDHLLASLVDRRIFQAIQIVDYQAICARNENQAQPDTSMLRSASQTMTPSSSGPSLAESSGIKSLSLAIAGNFVRNLMSSVLFVGSSLYSMLLYQSAPKQSEWDWWNSASEADQLAHFERTAVVGAQSAFMNQSMQLSLLPNKTYLRPCERKQTLYELSAPNEMPYQQQHQQHLANRPEYFVTRCGCSGWYVHQQVPKTNLLLLLVNITAACRRCPIQTDTSVSPVLLSPLLAPDQVVAPSDTLTVQQQLQQQQQLQREQQALQANRTAEDQVCSMLERDSQLYIRRQEFCISHHPDEAEIKICGGAERGAIAPKLQAIGLLSGLVSLLVAVLS